jgi:DNA-binding response OmpR family regulator
VDDENDLRMLVAERLGMEGYHVAEAARVKDAVKMLGQSDYDLLLLDVRLPDGTGLDVLKYMKDAGKTMPVIMLTGTTGLDIAVESVRLGARDYVTKPAKLSYLLHSIRELLTGDAHETARK